MDVGFIFSRIVKYAFVLPLSRKQEYEADVMALFLMARANYNPEDANFAINKLEKEDYLKFFEWAKR